MIRVPGGPRGTSLLHFHILESGDKTWEMVALLVKEQEVRSGFAAC